MNAESWKSLPKVELHCHLDACLRLGTAADIGRQLGVTLPAPLEPALVAPDVCESLADYLRCLDLALELLQRPQDLRRVAEELVEDMAREGVVYAEVRFAPQLHGRRGMTPRQAVEVVHAGLRAAAERHGVVTGLILCCLRHRPAAENLEVAQLAAANPERICALDLAGDEGGHPDAEPHARAFALARAAGLGITAHAGENAGAASVRQVLDRLGAVRVGHGVRVEEDAGLTDRLANERIALDMCPRSNVQTRAVESLARHPIDRLLRRDVPVTVSTDGRTSSGTTLTAEFERLRDQFGWGLAEFGACQRNAARAAFASERVRDDLLSRLASLP